MHIVSTMDDVGVGEYLTLVRSIRAHGGGIPRLKVIALTGNVTADSMKRVRQVADETRPFATFASYRRYDAFGDGLGHPLGKFAKLFFALEYFNENTPDDEMVMFLDPDVYVQRPLRQFVKFLDDDALLFGHEIQHSHHMARPNARLKVAHYFDDPGGWWATYVTEINTGVILGRAATFKRIMGDFENFVLKSDYFKKAMPRAGGARWHDQDFFRYFYRKTMRTDIGVLDLEQIFTTTRGAAKCLYFDMKRNQYRTVWGATPFVVHFAGGTLGKIPRKPPVDETPAPTPPVLSAAPATTHHLAYVAQADDPVLEHWIARLPRDEKVSLLVAPDAGDTDDLQRRYEGVSRSYALAHPPEDDASLDQLKAVMREVRPHDVVLPSGLDAREIEFLPGYRMPDLRPLYPAVRGLWRAGARRFRLRTFAGSVDMDIPWLLDGLVNRHQGKRCFVVGNGPSLNDLDMGLLKNEITFGSNRCYMGYEQWGYGFTYWGCMDRLQVEKYALEYERNVPEDCIKLFPFEYMPLFRFKNACPVNLNYEWRPPYRFSGTPGELFLGFTVTHMLLQTAVIMGCNPIYLIGVDHRYNLSSAPEKKRKIGKSNAELWVAGDAAKPTHFTSQYTGGAPKEFVKPRPERAEACFEVANTWVRDHSLKILNATPGTALTAFPLVDFNSLFPK